MGGPHLVILTLDFPPARGGVQTYLYEIALRIAAVTRVTVLTPAAGDLPPGSLVDKVVLPFSSPLGLWQTVRRLDPDRILLGHCHPRLFLGARPFGRFAAIAHGNDFLAAQRRWHRRLFNAALRRAAPLITISQANARRLEKLGVPPAAVIPPGTDPERFFPAPVPETRPVLLTVGRLVTRKGHATVLRALPEVVRRYPDLEWRVAGTGPEGGRLRALAEALGVADHVRFLGAVVDDALPDLYREASVFVMPVQEEEAQGSIEGFGIVYLEASASGMPVIAGRSGGAQEAVREGETGLLVEPDDPAGLGQAIMSLLADQDARRQMGAAGRRWVEREMNWDRAAAQFLEALG